MVKNQYDGVVERWKVDLIADRARRMGFRADEIPDIEQEVVMDLAEFQFDPAKSNGAGETTALVAVIDNKLKTFARSSCRYRAYLDRLRNEPEPIIEDTVQQRTMDVQDAVESLPELEQFVCNALIDGCTKHQIAKQLNCGWHTVNRIIERLRDEFQKMDLDSYLAN